jgi:SAM-dependent methyltransferase
VVVSASRESSAVLWHDLECGSYTADLPLWRELACLAGAGAPSGAVLDIGAGTGRVALDLARRGHVVTALDLDPELLDALRERAAKASFEARVGTVCADARTFELSRRDFVLCLAPMQTVQLLGGADGRIAFLRRVLAHLRPGGVLACAIVTDLEPFDCDAGDLGPSPEIARLDGSVYVSRATRVHLGRRSIRIERERSVLAKTLSNHGDTELSRENNRAAALAARGAAAAAGQTLASERPAPQRPAPERDLVELDRVSVSRLRREGREAGLTALGTRSIPATEEHAGSVVVMLGTPRA